MTNKALKRKKSGEENGSINKKAKTDSTTLYKSHTIETNLLKNEQVSNLQQKKKNIDKPHHSLLKQSTTKKVRRNEDEETIRDEYAEDKQDKVTRLERNNKKTEKSQLVENKHLELVTIIDETAVNNKQDMTQVTKLKKKKKKDKLHVARNESNEYETVIYATAVDNKQDITQVTKLKKKKKKDKLHVARNESNEYETVIYETAVDNKQDITQVTKLKKEKKKDKLHVARNESNEYETIIYETAVDNKQDITQVTMLKKKKKDKLQVVGNKTSKCDQVDSKKSTIDDTLNKDSNQNSERKSDSLKVSKQKKLKKKKDKSTTNDSVDGKEENKISAKDHAISYLKLWKKHRDQWKFKKVRQHWLLKHMYDSSKVADKHFDTLLEYLDGMKGKGRQETSTKAQNIIESDSDDVLKTERARKVVQMLATE